MPPPRFRVAAPLESAALDLEALRQDARAQLLEILGAHQGSSKLLILDPSLGNLLSHVLTDASKVFESMGVSQIVELGTDMSQLARGMARGGALAMDFSNCLFFVRPSVAHCKLLAEHIRSIQKVNQDIQRFSVSPPPRAFRPFYFRRVGNSRSKL